MINISCQFNSCAHIYFHDENNSHTGVHMRWQSAAPPSPKKVPQKISTSKAFQKMIPWKFFCSAEYCQKKNKKNKKSEEKKNREKSLNNEAKIQKKVK